MLKHYLKTLVLMSVFTLFLCCSIDQKAFAAKTVYSFGSGSYTIISEQKKTVKYEGISEKAYTVADIPDKVELKVSHIVSHRLKIVPLQIQVK